MSTETGGEAGTGSSSPPENLDWRSQEILRAIYENDGAANTSEIRQFTGIDTNDKVLYRFREKLVPAGLIELEQPDSETARPEPKIATFTAAGVEVAERISDQQSEGGDLATRVEQLEARYSRLSDQMDGNGTSPEDSPETPSDGDLAELHEKTDKLLYQMGLVADFLNEKHDGGLSDYRERREAED